MPGRIALALAIHNHQPVGNFGWVFQDVYDQAYLPLVQTLERHPGVRLSLHYTGPLIEWIRRQHPEFLDELRALVERGQVEVLGGGYYEPVLAALPERDRHGQLVRMADEVEGLVGRRPRGAWLAERVWEPQLPSTLADAGYDWTILDDNHFRSASIPEDEMWGAYVTEDQGRLLRVFGTEQGLRYRIPFGVPDDVIAYLRDHATEDGRRVGMMGDDGEKFGSWPGTFEHCWGRGRWVDRFFELLEANADWLTTVTPSDWLDREVPVGRVYVPTASYIEMGEWALPADEANTFTALIKRALADDLPEKRFLRGGFWRNFQARYREINDLHKQMVRASAKVAAMPEGAAKDDALDHLYQGQSNDCYWHGLFGGIYIVHMRLATCAHLIAAEDIADAAMSGASDTGGASAGTRGAGAGAASGAAGTRGAGAATGTSGAESLGAAPSVGSALLDVDLDGVPEAYLASAGQVVVIDLAEGAAASSWDLRAARLALTSVMRRRPEAYHATLLAHERAEAEGASADATESGAPRTIHDIVMTKEPGLGARLIYDRHERRSGLVHVVPPGTDPDTFRREAFEELGDVLDLPYRLVHLEQTGLLAEREGMIDGQPVLVRKAWRTGGGRADPSLDLDVTVHHGGDGPLRADLVLEWNVDLAGGGGNPGAFYLVPAGAGREAAVRHAHDSTAHPGTLAGLAFGNEDEGATVHASFEPPADVAWYPVETVSNSEAGFERQYQGSCLLLRWPLALGPGDTARVAVRHRVSSARDHRAEETQSRP